MDPPPAAEVDQQAQGRVRSLQHLTVTEVHHRFQRIGKPCGESLLSCASLQWCESEHALAVHAQQPVHRAVAQAAYAVEEEDSLARHGVKLKERGSGNDPYVMA